MKIEAVVKPGSKKEEVVCLGGGRYRIFVKERAREGKANEAVRDLLADYFGVPKSKVLFLQGLKGKTKRLEIVHE